MRPVAAADSKTASVEQRVEELVRQLGDAAYIQREHASKELIRLGSPAQVAPKAALKDPDAEVRFRAAEAWPSSRKPIFKPGWRRSLPT